jgi:hypothetical protein
MLVKARTGARARASSSMLSKYVAPYGTSLAELTIVVLGSFEAENNVLKQYNFTILLSHFFSTNASLMFHSFLADSESSAYREGVFFAQSE